MSWQGGSWRVEHHDGSYTYQRDVANPAFVVAAGEVPYRAIEWTRVRTVTFESQQCVSTFDFHGVPDGYQVSLRSRHFLTLGNDRLFCYLIVTSRADEEVAEDSVASVVYWFPDGAHHTCHELNCPAVAAYGSHWANGKQHRLVPEHGLVESQIDASVAG